MIICSKNFFFKAPSFDSDLAVDSKSPWVQASDQKRLPVMLGLNHSAFVQQILHHRPIRPVLG